MRPIVTDAVAWSQGLSVCHDREPCKNGWTDRDVAWNVDSGGSTEARITQRCTLAAPSEYNWTVYVRRRCSLFVKLLRPLVLHWQHKRNSLNKINIRIYEILVLLALFVFLYALLVIFRWYCMNVILFHFVQSFNLVFIDQYVYPYYFTSM